MKKLLTLITLVILTFNTAKAQNGWVMYKADNHISLKFPKQPEILKPGTMGTVGTDSVKCGISIIDLNKVAHLDSATVATLKENPEFVDQMRMSMQQSGKLTIEPFKMGTWHGLTSYTTSGVGPDNKKLNMLMLVYGTNIYNIFTIIPPNVKGNIGDTFFNSITFTK